MPMTRSRSATSTRRPTAAVATAIVAVVALTQVTALIPPLWWGPLLDIAPAQYVIIVIGIARDELGGWPLLLALIGLALSVRAVRARGHRFRRGLVALAAAAVLSTTITSALLVVTAAQAGAGLHLFAPALPFRADAEAPDSTVTLAEVGGERLQADLYLPAGRRDAPVVVSVHGGGFDGGDKGPNAYHRHLADRGYAVLDI